jgi:uncharacterized membrane-anchored protein YhcB (DUF1043 family)
VEQSILVWLVPAFTLLVGIAIGFLIARLAPGAAPSRTQSQLDELQERFDTYQSEVITHFNTTASLVKKLTQSYHDVQQHLADGADQLALDELTRQRLLAAVQNGNDYVGSRDRLQAPSSTEPPKDYAPKPAGSPGTLDEDFGVRNRS